MDAVKLLGSLLGNNATGGNLLGSILGGRSGGEQQQPQRTPRQSGGAADLLGSLLGGGASRQQSGAGGLLGSLLGGGGARGDGGSNLLGGLLKAAMAKQMVGAGSGGAGAMGLLGGLLGGGDDSELVGEEPDLELANQQATILIRAMCNAAKADGDVDRSEQQKIIARLGDLDQQEIDFVQQELAAPLDVNSFASSVPRELGPQVYALSVMTVRVDTRQEVTYLAELARGLGLDQQTVDAIHQQAGLA